MEPWQSVSAEFRNKLRLARSHWCWAFAYLALLQPATADDADVSRVETPGTGRYERNTNYLFFTAGKSHEASIPTRISEGDRIAVRYRVDDQIRTEEFSVKRISARDTLCRLHDTVRSPHSTSVGNIIYIKPCKVIAK